MSEQEENKEIIEESKSVTEEFTSAISDEHMRRMKELAPLEFYNIDVDGKIIKFNRRKIRSAERLQLESLRQKLAESVTSDDSKDYPKLEDQLYKKMASLYLIDSNTNKGMTEAQFGLTEFEEIKSILNACAFRTERPIPPPLETKKSIKE